MAPLRQLLAWYESAPILRILIRYLPFGSGAAVDVALLATRQRIEERQMLVEGPAKD